MMDKAEKSFKRKHNHVLTNWLITSSTLLSGEDLILACAMINLRDSICTASSFFTSLWLFDSTALNRWKKKATVEAGNVCGLLFSVFVCSWSYKRWTIRIVCGNCFSSVHSLARGHNGSSTRTVPWPTNWPVTNTISEKKSH